MGYFLIKTDSRAIETDLECTAAFQPVGPTILRSSSFAGQETHTPGLQVQDRGLRFNPY